MHPLIDAPASYEQLHPSCKWRRAARYAAGSIQKRVETFAPVSRLPGKPCKARKRSPMRFQTHLQRLHPFPGWSAAAEPSSERMQTGTYRTYTAARPLTVRESAYFLPPRPVNLPMRTQVLPPLPPYPLSLILLRSLTGTYNDLPDATHALTPHFKGVSARGVRMAHYRCHAWRVDDRAAGGGGTSEFRPGGALQLPGRDAPDC